MAVGGASPLHVSLLRGLAMAPLVAPLPVTTKCVSISRTTVGRSMPAGIGASVRAHAISLLM